METIKIYNVRLSFPSLYRRSTYKGIEKKYEATFLIDKALGLDNKRNIDREVAELLKKADIKVPSENLPLKDGSMSKYDGYSSCWSLKAASNIHPILLDKNKKIIEEENSPFYPGALLML